MNATCISLRSESDRSDSRLRCFGWPFFCMSWLVGGGFQCRDPGAIQRDPGGFMRSWPVLRGQNLGNCAIQPREVVAFYNIKREHHTNPGRKSAYCLEFYPAAPPPKNASCISLRSESDRSDSRLRCLGCCPAKSNHQAPHAAFFLVLPHGSWSAELPPPE